MKRGGHIGDVGLLIFDIEVGSRVGLIDYCLNLPSTFAVLVHVIIAIY